MSFLSPYGAVLRTPHACGSFVSSLAGRLCYGIVSLSLILTLTDGRHDYGFTGFVMALFGAPIVLVSPFRAWMVDRHGPRRALPPMAVGFAGVLVAIAVIPVRSGVNDAAIAVLAAAAGAFAPPLGVVMRTLWSALIDDPKVLQTAYSLDGVAEELLYVTGPVMGLAVVLIPAALSPNLLVLALLVGLAGVLVSPALSTAYLLTGSLASPRARNRAGNWVNSGYNAGASAGTVVSGQLVGRIPLSACLPALMAPALLALVPLLRARLTPTTEQPTAPGGLAADTVPPAAEAACGDR
jgi:MFS family permease